MKRITSALLAATAVLGAATGACASTLIDFSEHAFTSPGYYGANYYNSLTSHGFEFSNPLKVAIYATNHYANVNPGGAVLASEGNSITRVRRLDDQAFNLDSFDFADMTNSGAPGMTFNLTFFDGVGLGSRTLTFDAARGPQTADLQLKDIRWFTVQTQGQFDNFRMSDAAPGGVPEPAAWALMIMGFGGVGAALRRRSRPVAI